MPADTTGWRLRLRDESEAVVGAGILIAPDRALTSAHVLPHPEAALTVDYADCPGTGPSVAHAVPGAVVPRSEQPPDGDVALLAIHPTRPRARPAPLRRIPRYTGLHVRLGGFPAGSDHGLWVRARIDGPYGAWMQLTPEDPAYVAAPGFSGTAVANAQLDRVSAEPPAEVLGMVVSRYYDESTAPEFERRHAFMIPLDRIAKLLPEVARLVRGRPLRDVSLTSRRPAPGSGVDLGFTRRLVDWFSARAGPHVLLTAAAEGSGRDLAFAAVLHRADVALDAGGRTPAQLAARLAELLRWPEPYGTGLAAWLRGDGARPARRDSGEELTLPLTVAVAAVDESRDPAGTVALLVRLRTLGSRLLTVFRRTGGPGWDEARQMLLYPALRAYAHALIDEVIALERGRRGRRVANARVAALRALGREPGRLRLLETLLERLRADIAALEAGETNP